MAAITSFFCCAVLGRPRLRWQSGLSTNRTVGGSIPRSSCQHQDTERQIAPVSRWVYLWKYIALYPEVKLHIFKWIQPVPYKITLVKQDSDGVEPPSSCSMTGPLSCWHLAVAVVHDRGGSWWWILMAALDNDWTIVASDGGSWSWWQLTIDWLQQDSLIYSIPQFIAAKTLILIMFSFTLDIYCTFVHPGRGIPHMWLSLRFLLSFYPVKRFFFSSFSLLLLRVKGRGCHTLLKPYETNCDLWIWAIQIKFDWLIDWPAVQFSHPPITNVT